MVRSTFVEHACARIWPYKGVSKWFLVPAVPRNQSVGSVTGEFKQRRRLRLRLRQRHEARI